MADPRIGDRATSRTPPRERILGFLLLCLFLALAVLLVGACNHDLAPPGTGSGAGGSSAGAGGAPRDACAQMTSPYCCDDTTGVFSLAPPCGPDGFQQACPAGTHHYDYHLGCIPAGLGVTECSDLDGKACSFEPQGCIQGDTECSCSPTAGDGGALTWQCFVLL